MRTKSRLKFESRAGFNWGDVYDQLDWLPDGGLNIAHEAVDRHARGPLRDRVALVWLGRDGEREEHTFGGLAELTGRFANVLVSLGVEQGDRICICLDRLPELYVALLGTLKTGAVVVMLPSRSSANVIKDRMLSTRAKVLVAQPETRRSLHTAVFEMFDLQHIVVVNKDRRDPLPIETADLDYDEEMGKAPADFTVAPTGQYDYASIHYAEAGPAVVQAHLSVAQHLAAGKWALGLTDGDLLWSLADPASPAGTSFGLVAPWTAGARLLVYEEDADTAACYAAVEKHRVSVLHAPAGAVEDIAAAGKGIADGRDLSSLRHVVTDGGSLAADIVERASVATGSPVYDTWLQAETGTAVIASSSIAGVRPGSAGTAMPGVEIAVMGDDHRTAAPGAVGELAVRPGWPSMFRGYWGDRRRSAERFRRGWYMTGQRASIDAGGFVWLADR
jgi:acetyl-CoA synthetase